MRQFFEEERTELELANYEANYENGYNYYAGDKDMDEAEYDEICECLCNNMSNTIECYTTILSQEQWQTAKTKAYYGYFWETDRQAEITRLNAMRKEQWHNEINKVMNELTERMKVMNDM